VGLKLNRTRQLLPYADDINLLRDDIDTNERNTETLIVASKEVCRVVSLPERRSKSGHEKKNKSFENMSQFEYLKVM
jgi:hypothetical protein